MGIEKDTRICKTIALLAMGLLIGGAPTHFTSIMARPTRAEVSDMITKEAPKTVMHELKDMVKAQTDIKIEQTRISVTIESVLNEIKRNRI